MSIHGVNGDVSVEDRTAECLTAIAAIYEDGIAHVAFLSKSWNAPPAPSASVLLAAAFADPVVVAAGAQPAEPVPAQPVPAPGPAAPVEAAATVPADEPVAVPLAEEPAMLPTDVVADAPTATDLPVVSLAEPVTDLPEVGDDPTAEPGRVLVLADAVTAEIPVQAAA